MKLLNLLIPIRIMITKAKQKYKINSYTEIIICFHKKKCSNNITSMLNMISYAITLE